MSVQTSVVVALVLLLLGQSSQAANIAIGSGAREGALFDVIGRRAG